MSHRNLLLSLLVLLIVFSLACSTLAGVSERVGETKATVESVVTKAVSLVTEGAPLIETVQVYVTEAPDLKDTVEAAITENTDVVETVEAIATQGINTGDAPDDIPVVDESTIQNFYGSDALVSYTTSQDFDTVVNFYKDEMPANGWEADSSMTFEIGDTATLTWNQTDRQAIVIITANPADNTTIVAITIQPR